MANRVTGIKMDLTKREAHQVLDKVEDIEISKDGKRGFNVAELKEAKEFLVKKGFMFKSMPLDASTLTRFLVKFRQKVRKIPADYETNCRTVDCNGDPAKSAMLGTVHCPSTARKVCDKVSYSMRILIGDQLSIKDVQYESSKDSPAVIDGITIIPIHFFQDLSAKLPTGIKK
ncbi:MAG: hypothetical protein HN337_08925 [Deltaproteobacteria bacterium]|nr:hypothetical protein [Deltaproteobacteria bacterium]